MHAAPIVSPCIALCQMDEPTGWCIGCGRTIDEIVRWGATADEDRAVVMDALPERMDQLARANRSRSPGP
ncbi:DUF1289 domain-containing protein [Sphingomonas sp. M1-B02]|uniref:DUF1289 domain-containing protein n=1 Tax=Sphingomonas sp. M1-B02 TaxID=3114300 RepID=UPI00223F9F70|nr:DUF1289 domain-containing protein [Sphingomonas sp. S6-11]UZK67588.1 DUF1289 domain-containing protein [Sphingomonas sp. S6-11]